MVSKILDEAPEKYPLVRSLSVLDPRELLKSKELNIQKLTTILRLLVESGRIEEKCCDDVLREYDHNLMTASDSFTKFIKPIHIKFV